MSSQFKSLYSFSLLVAVSTSRCSIANTEQEKSKNRQNKITITKLSRNYITVAKVKTQRLQLASGNKKS
jgi:hypothetical protein